MHSVDDIEAPARRRRGFGRSQESKLSVAIEKCHRSRVDLLYDGEKNKDEDGCFPNRTITLPAAALIGVARSQSRFIAVSSRPAKIVTFWSMVRAGIATSSRVS